MTNVKEILDYLFTIAPAYMKEEWDNVGLLCGRKERTVTRVLVALDASLEVLHEAKNMGCELVVSHHPLIFGGLKQLNADTVCGKTVLFAAENQIACINMHTNLDCVSDGVNDILARRLGLKDITLAESRGTDEQGRPYGYVRCGMVETQTAKDFASVVKEKLSCCGVRFCDGGKPVKKVAVGGGACGDEIPAVLKAGCDTFVTADLKYHAFCDAKELGLNLIDAGHFATEVPVCDYLVQCLEERFQNLQISCSQKQCDPIEFI